MLDMAYGPGLIPVAAYCTLESRIQVAVRVLPEILVMERLDSHPLLAETLHVVRNEGFKQSKRIINSHHNSFVFVTCSRAGILLII